MTTMGLMVGYFACYGLRELSSSLAWRLPFALLAAFSVTFAVSVFVWLPESPRWLALHGKETEAVRAWEKLEVASADREKIALEGNAVELVSQVAPSEDTVRLAEPALAPSTARKTGFLDAFAPDVRARTLLGIFAMGMQQMSGIDGILYVSCLPSSST